MVHSCTFWIVLSSLKVWFRCLFWCWYFKFKCVYLRRRSTNWICWFLISVKWAVAMRINCMYINLRVKFRYRFSEFNCRNLTAAGIYSNLLFALCYETILSGSFIWLPRNIIFKSKFFAWQSFNWTLFCSIWLTELVCGLLWEILERYSINLSNKSLCCVKMATVFPDN